MSSPNLSPSSAEDVHWLTVELQNRRAISEEENRRLRIGLQDLEPAVEDLIRDTKLLLHRVVTVRGKKTFAGENYMDEAAEMMNTESAARLFDQIERLLDCSALDH
jgi:hypothetical protein